MPSRAAALQLFEGEAPARVAHKKKASRSSSARKPSILESVVPSFLALFSAADKDALPPRPVTNTLPRQPPVATKQVQQDEIVTPLDDGEEQAQQLSSMQKAAASARPPIGSVRPVPGSSQRPTASAISNSPPPTRTPISSSRGAGGSISPTAAPRPSARSTARSAARLSSRSASSPIKARAEMETARKANEQHRERERQRAQRERARHAARRAAENAANEERLQVTTQRRREGLDDADADDEEREALLMSLQRAASPKSHSPTRLRSGASAQLDRVLAARPSANDGSSAIADRGTSLRPDGASSAWPPFDESELLYLGMGRSPLHPQQQAPRQYLQQQYLQSRTDSSRGSSPPRVARQTKHEQWHPEMQTMAFVPPSPPPPPTMLIGRTGVPFNRGKAPAARAAPPLDWEEQMQTASAFEIARLLREFGHVLDAGHAHDCLCAARVHCFHKRRRDLVHARAQEGIISCMRSHASSEQVQIAGCEVLGLLACDDHLEQALFDAGALEVCLEACAAYPTSESVQAASFQAISNVCFAANRGDDPEGCERKRVAVEMKAFEAICEGMLTAGARAKWVQEAGVCAIAGLCNGLDVGAADRQWRAKETGAIGLALEVMELFTPALAMRSHAAAYKAACRTVKRVNDVDRYTGPPAA